jgi:hypothetical protein
LHAEGAVDVRSIRFWIRRFKSGETDTGDRNRSAAAEFNATGTKRLTETWKIFVDNKGNFDGK